MNNFKEKEKKAVQHMISYINQKKRACITVSKKRKKKKEEKKNPVL